MGILCQTSHVLCGEHLTGEGDIVSDEPRPLWRAPGGEGGYCARRDTSSVESTWRGRGILCQTSHVLCGEHLAGEGGYCARRDTSSVESTWRGRGILCQTSHVLCGEHLTGEGGYCVRRATSSVESTWRGKGDIVSDKPRPLWRAPDGGRGYCVRRATPSVESTWRGRGILCQTRHVLCGEHLAGEGDIVSDKPRPLWRAPDGGRGYCVRRATSSVESTWRGRGILCQTSHVLCGEHLTGEGGYCVRRATSSVESTCRGGGGMVSAGVTSVE